MRDRALQPPPKHPLQLGGQKELLDQRRADLERWMWQLIGRPEIARGGAIKAFLEFDKAMARAAQLRCVCGSVCTCCDVRACGCVCLCVVLRACPCACVCVCW
jgi:hypothetical protein